MNLNPNVLAFIIEKAKSRESVYGKFFPKDCQESIEIFDELDSLLEEELQPIVVIFLLGKRKYTSRAEAEIHAKVTVSNAVEAIAFDPDLPSTLSDGYNIWQKG